MSIETRKNLDFYYGNEAEQFTFYRIPKILFLDKLFSKISSDAKILYGLLLDRMTLSAKKQLVRRWKQSIHILYNWGSDGSS